MNFTEESARLVGISAEEFSLQRQQLLRAHIERHPEKDAANLSAIQEHIDVLRSMHSSPDAILQELLELFEDNVRRLEIAARHLESASRMSDT